MGTRIHKEVFIISLGIGSILCSLLVSIGNTYTTMPHREKKDLEEREVELATGLDEGCRP
jgi:hypothetical protein